MMRTFVICVVVFVAVSACGASQDEPTQTMPSSGNIERLPVAEMASEEEKIAEAVIVTGIAATAQAIQKARSMDPGNLPANELCCAKCPEGYFPCGNECKPQGMIPPCLDPPGCACYEGEETQTMPPEAPPIPADQFPTNAQ